MTAEEESEGGTEDERGGKQSSAPAIPTKGSSHLYPKSSPVDTPSAGLVGRNDPLSAPPLHRPGMGPAFSGRHQSAREVRPGGRPIEMSSASHRPKRFQGSASDFSIDHILNVAGGRQNSTGIELSTAVAAEEKKFEWLSCTRYKPPRLPRQGKKEGLQRRKLGRNPRIPFSSSQVAFLEAKFLRTPYLSSSDVASLAAYLNLSETRVKIWFQNRRARDRREKESKAKGTEDSAKREQVFESQRSTVICPLNLPKFDRGNTVGHIAYTQTVNYLQVVTPLDLSERQVNRLVNN